MHPTCGIKIVYIALLFADNRADKPLSRVEPDKALLRRKKGGKPIMLDISDDDWARSREMAAKEARENKRIEFVVFAGLLALAGAAFYILSLLPSVVWKYAAIAAGLAIVGAILFFARKVVWSLAACIFVIGIAIQFPSASIIAAATVIAGVIVASAISSKKKGNQS